MAEIEKICCTDSKIETLRKINAIIDNTSNTDLSNLSEEGRAKFNAKVNKAGDNMTGSLTMEAMLNLKGANNQIDFSSTAAPSSTLEGGWISFRDKNGQVSGQVFNVLNTSNVLQTKMQVRRSISGTTKSAEIVVNVDESGNGYVTAPASSIANSIVTTAAIQKTANGYIKFGNGIIIQWGYVQCPANSTTVTVTLPISFTQDNYAVAAMHWGSNAEPTVSTVMVWEPTTSNFKLNQKSTNTNVLTRKWIAIGY